ncbi:hypothetical protein BGZ75_001568, partial [Mortierella antarctica]
MPATSVDTLESSLSPSVAAPTEVSTSTNSNTLDSGNVQLGNQDGSTRQERQQSQGDEENIVSQTAIVEAELILPSTQSDHTSEESMAMDVDSDNSLMDDEDDPFELSDIEVPDEDVSEARATVKELLGVQELQLRKLLAIKRHIQQNPGQAKKYETRLPDMKKILDARATKIKDLKAIINAYDAIRAESNKTDYVDSNVQHRPQESTMAVRTNGNRSYQQPAFLNIPSHWPRFRGPTGIANTQQFFDAFKRQVVPAINPEAFLHDGARYLGLLIQREEDVDAFNEVLKEEPVERYDVDTLERLFLSACITPEEREQSLRDMATIGRLPHESWKTFALRVQKKVNQFQVTGDTTYL